jgi:hypothetical protein
MMTTAAVLKFEDCIIIIIIMIVIIVIIFYKQDLRFIQH